MKLKRKHRGIFNKYKLNQDQIDIVDQMIGFDINYMKEVSQDKSFLLNTLKAARDILIAEIDEIGEK